MFIVLCEVCLNALNIHNTEDLDLGLKKTVLEK